MASINEATDEKNKMYKRATCAALLFFSVSSTLCAQASKSRDGSYAYDTFVIPFAAESLKCVVSTVMECGTGGSFKGSEFKVQRFLKFSIPAACYFVSNNCMLYIIRELGGVTFQVTNNLKILSTGVLMRLFLGRKLTWLQWKALIILAVGCTVTQFKSCERADVKIHLDQNLIMRGFGYAMIVLNAFASGAGGVVSEKLLKGSRQTQESIHMQNAQLYLFGAVFGLVAIRYNNLSKSIDNGKEDSYGVLSMFDGFNPYAFAAVLSLAATGLLVSVILKYMDNFVKCFVAAVSMFLVALFDALMRDEHPTLQLFCGVTLTCLALEQYYFS